MAGYDWQTNRTIVDAGRWAVDPGTNLRRAEKRLGLSRAVHVNPSYLPDYALGSLGQEEGVVEYAKSFPWWAYAAAAVAGVLLPVALVTYLRRR